MAVLVELTDYCESLAWMLIHTQSSFEFLKMVFLEMAFCGSGAFASVLCGLYAYKKVFKWFDLFVELS